MAKKFNEALNVSESQIDTEGAFNGFVDIDSKFYIDPRLLINAVTPEFVGCHSIFEKYFNNVLKILTFSTIQGDKFWNAARKLLVFKEHRYISLGYSNRGNPGKAIGMKLAGEITNSAKTLIDAGIKDPDIFELLGVFEDNVGADRISDLTARILLKELLSFTNRIVLNLEIKNTFLYEFDNQKFFLPEYIKPIILVPREILTPLPVADSWDEIDIVCSHNDELRAKVNSIIGSNWKQATNRNRTKKSTLKEILLKEPELFKDLLKTYKSKDPIKYDFKKDPFGELIWHEYAQRYSNEYPLSLNQYRPITDDNILKVVLIIIEKFRSLIEDNGLSTLLYNEKRQLRHERYSQLLFYGIADAYCEANNLDLNREPNAGIGPVDFKISHGYKSKVNVEIKYSTNSNLFNGYVNQLPSYDIAEKTFHSVYLVIQTSNSESTITRLLRKRNENKKNGKRTPEIIIVDGKLKPSASKR